MPGRGPCEVLSAWLLRSPVATEGLLHGTSSPRQPTSEKEIWVAQMEGLLPSYFRAFYRSSATHDIPYENQCVGEGRGACGVCECWGGGELRADWGCRGACVHEGTCFYEEMQAFKLISAGACVVCPGTQIHTYKMVY